MHLSTPSLYPIQDFSQVLTGSSRTGLTTEKTYPLARVLNLFPHTVCTRKGLKVVFEDLAAAAKHRMIKTDPYERSARFVIDRVAY